MNAAATKDNGAGVGDPSTVTESADVDVSFDWVEVIFKRICTEAKINPQDGLEFYQFAQSVFSYVTQADNFAEFFASQTQDGKQKRLKQILMKGVEILFNNNSDYRNFVANLFTTGNSVGEASQLVLMLMRLIQNATVHGKIDGQQKHQFVKQSVKTIISFTDMSNSDQMLVMASVDMIIQGYIMVKHGALGAAAQKIAKCKCLPW